ncbi:MAG: phosphatidate cytidylyltransferase [Coriobacteriales bacterium]|jgi:phosphatidate cytidylyltransferase|nr:phosphatidate cytidylyltransferase [Coriobacteriales bacterium]
MQSRVITAVLFAGTTTLCLILSDISAVIVVSALSGLCAFELYAMLRSDAKLPNELIGTVAAALYPVMYYFFHLNGILILTTAFALVLFIWYVNYMRARIIDVAVTLFGALYTGFMLTSLVLIRGIVPGVWGGVLVFGVVLSVWANDAFAFFFGSRFGRHKMAPRISPAKSWEGFFAGLAASVIVWCLIPLIPGMSLPWGWAVFAGVACGWVGILGDLMESRIKRSTGHKDSGNLLPGHGGFLDRCDSLILVAALALLLLRIAGAPVL